ncbi:hypothetical protein [Haloechinothrix halophila]|uniref:hypothetical protein n=1 Tax=Haloechinothrix halophila TaxID=1069073 RepID=UPI00146FA447|nr:hypothetical protein [Haloechinothrix halophila]
MTNAEVGERVGVALQWIEQQNQIRTRRYAATPKATSDLTVRAAERALEQTDLAVHRMDFIIVSTSTPDSPSHRPPPTCRTHPAPPEQGASTSTSSAAGFPGAEVYSRILDCDERKTAVLLGDGTGAVVVGPVPTGYGVVACGLHTLMTHMS